MHIKAHNPSLRGGTLQSSTQAGQAQQKRDAESVGSVGQQLADNLFTRERPEALVADEYPELQALLVALEPYKRRLAALADDPQDKEYTLILAADGSAAIDERGFIFLGAGFLVAHRHNVAVIVGAIAHEIGHRPRRIKELRSKKVLSREQLNALLMQEEIIADRFAGFGLGELMLDCEPLIGFLFGANSPPHPAYLPVEERARLIRECHARGAQRAPMRKKLFPDFDRHTSIRNHIREL